MQVAVGFSGPKNSKMGNNPGPELKGKMAAVGLEFENKMVSMAPGYGFENKMACALDFLLGM